MKHLVDSLRCQRGRDQVEDTCTHSSREDQDLGIQAGADQLLQFGLVIPANSQRNHFCLAAASLGREHRAVAVPDLAGSGNLAGCYQFVASGEHGDTGNGDTADTGLANLGEQSDFHRPDAGAGSQHLVSAANTRAP